jgi:hypothetical protein
VVTGKFVSEVARLARQTSLNASPPNPGSILVADESEKWEVLSAKLESQDASTDGLALKKMIAAGAGIPMHFLAEPEGSTRTTAEAAGGPTFRHYEQRQEFFTWLLKDLIGIVVNRRALVDKKISKTSPIEVLGADISARDNISLAMAAMNIELALKDMRDRGLIDDAEMVRMIYRFCGEGDADIEKIIAAGKDAPASQPTKPTPPPKQPPIDLDTGEEVPITNP